MHWTQPYLGIPWQTGGRNYLRGLDCWGLLRHIYNHEFRIQLNEHPAALGHLADSPTVVATELEGTYWKETKDPQDGDGVALGKDEAFSHVGVYVFTDEPAIVHSARGTLSRIVTIRELHRMGYTFVRFYRHDLRRPSF